MATKENLFEGAKFGDRYQCRNGMQAVFVNNCYGEVTLLINDDDTKEDWLCSYELDGTADCDEEYDIVKRIGPWKTGSARSRCTTSTPTSSAKPSATRGTDACPTTSARPYSSASTAP